MSLVAWAIVNHIETYTSKHPISADYPQRDRDKLNNIADKIVAKMPELATGLDEILPKELKSETKISRDVRNAAVETTKRLMQLVPGVLGKQLSDVRKGMEYAWAREQFSQLRRGLPATPKVLPELKTLIVTFAVAEGIKPEQLERFSKQVTALTALVETERDDIEKLKFGDKILALEELTQFLEMGATPPPSDTTG